MTCGFLRSERLRKGQLAANVLQQPNLVVSTQVVNEVCTNLIKKAGFNEEQIREVIQEFEQGCDIAVLVINNVNGALLNLAIRISPKCNISCYFNVLPLQGLTMIFIHIFCLER